MIKKTIKLFATQIPYTDEELEENEVYVEFNVGELLDQIDDEDIGYYCKWNLDMKHEDDFTSDIGDFTENELIEALEDLNFNFSEKIDEDECIEFLEDEGYEVTFNKVVDYDLIDTNLLEDIREAFYRASFSKRQEMRDLILNM